MSVIQTPLNLGKVIIKFLICLNCNPSTIIFPPFLKFVTSSHKQQKYDHNSKITARNKDDHPRTSQARVDPGLQKSRQGPRDINSVVSRSFPGEKIPSNRARGSDNFKPKRSRSRSPLRTSKPSKMRIESERYRFVYEYS